MGSIASSEPNDCSRLGGAGRGGRAEVIGVAWEDSGCSSRSGRSGRSGNGGSGLEVIGVACSMSSGADGGRAGGRIGSLASAVAETIGLVRPGSGGRTDVVPSSGLG